MTFALLAQIIAKEGLPLALSLWQNYEAGKANTEVTAADIADLVAAGAYTSGDALKAAGGQIINGKLVLTASAIAPAT